MAIGDVVGVQGMATLRCTARVDRAICALCGPREVGVDCVGPAFGVATSYNDSVAYVVYDGIIAGLSYLDAAAANGDLRVGEYLWLRSGRIVGSSGVTRVQYLGEGTVICG